MGERAFGEPPDGDVYDWYQRGLALLASGDAAAAAQLLARAARAEPDSRSVREALARAQFDAGDYPGAKVTFSRIVADNPAEDYAQFGLGLAARRLGDLTAAVEHLALAAAMRPEHAAYARELAGARAQLAAGPTTTQQQNDAAIPHPPDRGTSDGG